MAKEIKNFKVWHPPPDQSVEDEPLTVTPISESYPRSYEMPRLTLTGWFWLLAPWGLLLAKRLSFSLLELWIWIVAWSMTAGSVVAVLKPAGAAWQNYAVLLYAAFHFHCMLFSAVLYDWRGTKGQASRRTANVLISQFLIASVAVGMALLARLR